MDLWDWLFQKRKPLVPPKGLIYTGPGDFIKIGDEFLKNFIEYCELAPDGKVLDAGCGIGRIARPLSGYLSSNGSYEGFDIVKRGIDWCCKAYQNFSNFNFRFIPLSNDLYNLSTSNHASQFTFPYPDKQFDLVVLTSVFTHMQEDVVKNYLKEISRVLKPGKYCFSTFFLITPESDLFLKKTRNSFFPHQFENYYLHDIRVKDANIAYRIEFLQNLLRDNSLRIKQIHPGWWSGRSKESSLNFQDIVILETM